MGSSFVLTFLKVLSSRIVMQDMFPDLTLEAAGPILHRHGKNPVSESG